jgi:hypothetical protein
MPCWENKASQLKHKMSRKTPPLLSKDNNTSKELFVTQRIELEQEPERSPKIKEGMACITPKEEEEGKNERRKKEGRKERKEKGKRGKKKKKKKKGRGKRPEEQRKERKKMKRKRQER